MIPTAGFKGPTLTQGAIWGHKAQLGREQLSLWVHSVNIQYLLIFVKSYLDLKIVKTVLMQCKSQTVWCVEKLRETTGPLLSQGSGISVILT